MLEINILKLALGTASFGMDYGLFNSSGQLKLQQVKRILELARTRSIKTLDTASSYGKSENILGQIEVSDWDIITKVSPVPNGILSVYDWIVSEVEKSLSRLRVTNIHGLLLHKTSDLKQNYGKEIWSALEHLKKSGIVQKIGYSIYETSELDDFWSNLNLISCKLL